MTGSWTDWKSYNRQTLLSKILIYYIVPWWKLWFTPLWSQSVAKFGVGVDPVAVGRFFIYSSHTSIWWCPDQPVTCKFSVGMYVCVTGENHYQYSPVEGRAYVRRNFCKLLTQSQRYLNSAELKQSSKWSGVKTTFLSET